MLYRPGGGSSPRRAALPQRWLAFLGVALAVCIVIMILAKGIASNSDSDNEQLSGSSPVNESQDSTLTAEDGLPATDTTQWSMDASSTAASVLVGPEVQRARDEVAARAMPEAGTGRAYGRAEPPTVAIPPSIDLPQAQDVDEVGVATGFPATQEGAVAQLAAIASAAADSSSLPGVERVRQGWVASGGPGVGEWTWRSTMAHLLTTMDAPLVGSPGVRVSGRPVMGLVKDTGGQEVGAGWAVVCVNVALHVQVNGAGHDGVVADCQRMLWDGRRWLIGPGAVPAQLVSQPEPGTDAAYAAGFRDLTAEPHTAGRSSGSAGTELQGAAPERGKS
ncbi:hypothetical protein [Kineosporia babensis]|uniref:Uncharacterized protein n=1 Tax=Kineosporia babensis TaxID=499548 RepID=A0A9X1NMH7_9ACTN|nr:hypothetical protein [Kineosporia babensis]MCD5316820.1 hypothetical protein [Kineosporia babensis]